MRGMRRARRLVTASLVALGMLACNGPGAEPTFRAASIFAESRRADTTQDGATTELSEDEDSLESRLRRRRAQGRASESPDGGDESGPDLGSVRLLSVAGRLQADLPVRSDRWSWAEDEGLLLMVHGTGGDDLDALIYAEAFSSLARRRSAAETRRFLLTVAPDLPSAGLRTVPELDARVARAGDEIGLPRRRSLRAVERILTSTLGRGLGFVPETEGFSGWKWLGRNPQGVFLRMGKIDGLWQGQPDLDPQVREVLEVLAQEAPELEDLLWNDPVSGRTDAGAAHLFLGSATLGDGWGEGVHLAILCRRARCPVEADVVRFLDSLRPPELGPSGRSTRPSDSLSTLAGSVGLQLFPRLDMRRRAVEQALERLDRAEAERRGREP